MDRRIGALLVVLAWLTRPDGDALADSEEETEPKKGWHRALEGRLPASRDRAASGCGDREAGAAARIAAASENAGSEPGAEGSVPRDPP